MPLFGAKGPVRAGRPARRQEVESNRLSPADRAFHDWYRFVLSFPPHLVRDYVERFGLSRGDCVLDPFCGTGTTLVECKKLGLASVGMEANPMGYLASQAKTDWAVDGDEMEGHARGVADAAGAELLKSGIRDEEFFGDRGAASAAPRVPLLRLPGDSAKLLLGNSISPLPLHKTLVLLGALDRRRQDRLRRHELLALAKALVTTIGNLHFGPEVGVGRIKPDSPVIAPWLANVAQMADDLRRLGGPRQAESRVFHADARAGCPQLPPKSVAAVITSPPYPNEKDYTRTTRLESVILGLVRDRRELRALKRGLMRSNTRNVYKGDDDDRWIAAVPEVHDLAERIEARRLALGKTSGFERMYARVTKLYFGGMARHLAALRPALRPDARLAYVVGDQASYLRVMIRTGQILARIAETLGYRVVCIDLFRTRLATATRQQLREEVVILRWPGN